MLVIVITKGILGLTLVIVITTLKNVVIDITNTGYDVGDNYHHA